MSSLSNCNMVWNTLQQMGPSQLMARVTRRLRYRYLYPWAARHLFPLPPSAETSPEARGSQPFHEKAAAHAIPRSLLLQQAEALSHHRFEFINLAAPPQSPSARGRGGEGARGRGDSWARGRQPLPFRPFALSPFRPFAARGTEGGRLVDWRFAPEGNRLWQYNLHYGEWALPLAQAFVVTGEGRFRDALIQLLADWLKQNPVGTVPGWEPYPLSRRLVAWSRVGLALCGDSEWQAFWERHLAPSLCQQASLLAANLEHDLLNNHLLANYRALAWVGLLFPSWPNARKWRQLGLAGLWSEMRRQVLPDGVHHERSISYQTIVLQDIIETWQLARHLSEPVPDDVEPTLVKMLHFLASTQAPDGTWPMVNDSVPDYPIEPRALLLAGGILFDRPEWVAQGKGGAPTYQAWLTGEMKQADEKIQVDGERVVVFPEAGYAVLRDEAQNYLFFDAGAMGPKRMPGHGHADALSIVLYGGGRPLIVDPGVYTYTGKWRDHFRSTAAHNTVSVDGQDQCLFWGPFRVAFAPQAQLLECSEEHLVGQHDGYRRLPSPVVHRRTIKSHGAGIWEIQDHFEGDGEHDFALTLQFALGAKAEVSELNGEVCWLDGTRLQIESLSPPHEAKASIEPGWLSPGWNLKSEAPRYVLRWRGQLPLEHKMLLKVVSGN